MIYKLEKRTVSGYGTCESHYEVICYTHRTPIGILANGKTLKKGSLKKCQQYIRTANIQIEIENEGGSLP